MPTLAHPVNEAEEYTSLSKLMIIFFIETESHVSQFSFELDTQPRMTLDF